MNLEENPANFLNESNFLVILPPLFWLGNQAMGQHRLSKIDQIVEVVRMAMAVMSWPRLFGLPISPRLASTMALGMEEIDRGRRGRCRQNGSCGATLMAANPCWDGLRDLAVFWRPGSDQRYSGRHGGGAMAERVVNSEGGGGEGRRSGFGGEK